jgi:acyl-CoA dehydrogenase
MEDDVVDQMFDFMIRDFSKFALQMYSKTGTTDEQMALCLNMIRKPVKNSERFNRVWKKHVAVLDGAYDMNP